MKPSDRQKLIDRVKTLTGLTDDERSALLGLLRESKSYGLVWEDKPEATEERLRNELPVLVEDRSKAIFGGGVNCNKSNNCPNHAIIEGDNLEALTTLAYTHAGKIDVIYIDPPYNTGNKDFIYNDSYVDSEDSYRHSKWLSFMSRRLRIAKKLLSDRGVIFISIDDNEQANLKLLCDEIFGNKCEQYIWCLQDPTEGSFVKTAGLTVRKEHEYILACFKSESKRFNRYKGKREFSEGAFSNPDNDPRGDWFSGNISRNGIKSTTGSKYYTITNPKGETFTRNWTLSKEEYDEALKDNRIFFAKEGAGVPRLKIFKNDKKDLIQSSLFTDVHTSITGKNELKRIFCGETPFNFPKNTNLISRLITISEEQNDSIILDFFAGSGTTLHAVMQLNAEDGGKRQCILCTNNENGICENVTYERNKRVINGYTKPNGEHVEGLHNNNLRYYRTNFVGRSRSTKNMRRMVALSTDMLCIKENLYTEHKTFAGMPTFKNIYRYFAEGEKRMLIIYDERYVDEIVGLIAKTDTIEPIKVYVFSPSEDPWEANFEPVSEKVMLCALPQAIYNAYKRILPKRNVGARYIAPASTASTEQIPGNLFEEL